MFCLNVSMVHVWYNHLKFSFFSFVCLLLPVSGRDLGHVQTLERMTPCLPKKKKKNGK